MEQTVRLSVIVPVRNGGKYLAQCIENLLFQTYKNLEIIVVDDGSTDDTAQIVGRFDTVRYIRQAQSGVSVARNNGLDAASGQYVHFMDADDLLPLDFYEKMLAAALATEADLACCGFYFERTPSLSQRIAQLTVVSVIEDKIRATNVCNYGACWRYLCRLSFLREHHLRFAPGIMAGEDRMFSLQAVYWAGRIVLVPNVQYIYKHRPASVTATKDAQLVRQRHRDRRHANRFVAEFAREHHFRPDKTAQQQRDRFRLLGVPLLTKRTFHPGKVRWYLLGIPVFQKKAVDAI